MPALPNLDDLLIDDEHDADSQGGPSARAMG